MANQSDKFDYQVGYSKQIRTEFLTGIIQTCLNTLVSIQLGIMRNEDVTGVEEKLTDIIDELVAACAYIENITTADAIYEEALEAHEAKIASGDIDDGDDHHDYA